MFNFFRKKTRDDFVSRNDERLIGIGRFITEPLSLSSYSGGELIAYPVGESNLEVESQIPKIYIRKNGIAFAWIQGVGLYRAENLAIVAHFAIDSLLTRTGMGQKVAYTFANHLKQSYGIEKINFVETEYPKKGEYRSFFEKKLGAIPNMYCGNQGWLWDISTIIDTENIQRK